MYEDLFGFQKMKNFRWHLQDFLWVTYGARNCKFVLYLQRNSSRWIKISSVCFYSSRQHHCITKKFWKALGTETAGCATGCIFKVCFEMLSSLKVIWSQRPLFWSDKSKVALGNLSSFSMYHSLIFLFSDKEGSIKKTQMLCINTVPILPGIWTLNLALPSFSFLHPLQTKKPVPNTAQRTLFFRIGKKEIVDT